MLMHVALPHVALDMPDRSVSRRRGQWRPAPDAPTARALVSGRSHGSTIAAPAAEPDPHAGCARAAPTPGSPTSSRSPSSRSRPSSRRTTCCRGEATSAGRRLRRRDRPARRGRRAHRRRARGRGGPPRGGGGEPTRRRRARGDEDDEDADEPAPPAPRPPRRGAAARGARPARGHLRPRRGGLRPVARPRGRRRRRLRRALGRAPAGRGHDRGRPDRHQAGRRCRRRRRGLTRAPDARARLRARDAAAVGRVGHDRLGRRSTSTPAIGRCYERNLAWAIGDADELDADELDRDIDRLFDDAGLRHRRLAVEPPAAARLAPGLAALGYERRRASLPRVRRRPARAAARADRRGRIEASSPPTTAGCARTPTCVRARCRPSAPTSASITGPSARAGADERCFAVLGADGDPAASGQALGRATAWRRSRTSSACTSTAAAATGAT